MAFSDGHIADALSGFPATGLKELTESKSEQSVMKARHGHAVHPIFRMVDSCAAEFAAKLPTIIQLTNLKERIA